MQKSDMQVVMGLYQVLKKFQYVDMYLTSIVLLLNCNGMTVIYQPAKQLLPMHTWFKILIQVDNMFSIVNIRKTTNLAYFIWPLILKVHLYC